MIAEFIERFAQQLQRGRPIDAVAVAALHRADNRRSAQRPGPVDDGADEALGFFRARQRRAKSAKVDA
jgi:hypothetical protein